MSLTTDPNHPGVRRGGPDVGPVEQHPVYLVLSEEERARGFVRPVRRSYRHVGPAGPGNPTRKLTEEEQARYAGVGYVVYEAYPEGQGPTGRYWTQQQLDALGRGCGTVTTMAQEIAETFARNPIFYGSAYCCGCHRHLRVGQDGEFVWDGTEERVGT